MSEAAVKTPARKSRPKYLNLQALLFEIRLPLPGWVSILHRVSGALLFVALVWLLWMLDRSLSSEAAFEKIKHYAGLVAGETLAAGAGLGLLPPFLRRHPLPVPRPRQGRGPGNRAPDELDRPRRRASR